MKLKERTISKLMRNKGLDENTNTTKNYSNKEYLQTFVHFSERVQLKISSRWMKTTNTTKTEASQKKLNYKDR